MTWIQGKYYEHGPNFDLYILWYDRQIHDIHEKRKKEKIELFLKKMVTFLSNTKWKIKRPETVKMSTKRIKTSHD